MKPLLHLPAALLLAGSALAQTYVFVPSDTPTTGGGNVIPFGTINTSATWVNQRYQTRVPTSTMGPAPLTISTLAFATGTAHVKTWDSLQITMAQTTNTPLDATFANNLQMRPTVVFNGKNHVWPVTANQWDTIGLQNKFLYIPNQGDLVIEIIAIGNHRLDATGTVGFYSYAGERMWATNWTGTPPLVRSGTDTAAALKMRLGVAYAAVDNFGVGCGSGPLAIAGNGSGQLNTRLDINLVRGPNVGAGLVWLGFSASPPLPVDLSALGFTGCRLQCGLDVPMGGVAFQNGTSTRIPIAIPNDQTLHGVQFYLQGLALDGSAPGGISLSDMLRVLLGL